MKNTALFIVVLIVAGAAGFGNNGLVAVRDTGSVGLKDRARFKKLVNAENKDRNALYRETEMGLVENIYTLKLININKFIFYGTFS